MEFNQSNCFKLKIQLWNWRTLTNLNKERQMIEIWRYLQKIDAVLKLYLSKLTNIFIQIKNDYFVLRCLWCKIVKMWHLFHLSVQNWKIESEWLYLGFFPLLPVSTESGEIRQPNRWDQPSFHGPNTSYNLNKNILQFF